MRSILTIFHLFLFLGLVLFFLSCEDRVFVYEEDDTPPSVPKGLRSITGDEKVYLYWYENDEDDFKEYWIYKKLDGETYYRYYKTVKKAEKAEYVDYGVKNGETYWYRVLAVDYAGNTSDLSDPTYDTPRPEGWNEMIFDFNHYPASSGFDFSQEEVVSWNDLRCDIYLEYVDGVYYICVGDENTDIQGFGYTDSIQQIDMAPDTTIGWSALWCVEAIKGHCYIIWTRDDHYAKIRITDFTKSFGMLFDWAYQIDPGNPELKIRPPEIADMRQERNL